jgi:hypothetical protein
MRIPSSFTDSDLRDAHAAAGVVASEKHRPYLGTSRLLPLLAARLRDDAAEALGMPAPPLPRRSPVTPRPLGELTSGELAALLGAVGTLVDRFTRCMDDPELPRLLASLRAELAAEQDDRDRIAAEMALKARAS